jgi:adenine-specific DNA-methyltransferase
MAAKKKPKATDGLPPTADYRHEGSTRKNLPGAAMAGEGEVPKAKRVKYAYSPHLDPVLRFDPTGRADKVAAIVDKACRGERLDAGEQEILRAVGKNWEQPWLEWAGKQEEHARGQFSVDPVALHIHERISAQAILRAAMRQDAEPSLFARPEQSYAESLKFYKHDVDWANRLILGDSLQVMSSLAHRENLAGKVQMIYIDPPYGIRFGTNFQPEVMSRDVKDRDEDVVREPEMIRAYRDTWTMGRHSWLTYLRARLEVAKELLHSSGSVFVQIDDKGLGCARDIVDSVFGSENFQSVITFRSSVPLKSTGLPTIGDYVIWYSRCAASVKRYDLYLDRLKEAGSMASYVEERSGHRRPLTNEERDSSSVNGRIYATDNLVSSGYTPTCIFPVVAAGRKFTAASGKSWKTNQTGMQRLLAAERVSTSGQTLRAMAYVDDYPVQKLSNFWTDTTGAPDKSYVVETATRVIPRCILMTTDPGDLVLDPTCGSGTTAYASEQLGRRWITIDTSRVALSIARQRLLTAKFDHYRTVAGPQGSLGSENPASGFRYKSVPHITLGAIAQNTNLDPIFAKHEPILAAKLQAANAALSAAPAFLRDKLKAKLAAKEKAEKKKSITEADRRRWLLPPENRDPNENWTFDARFAAWHDSEVPFDTDPDWPKPLQDAVAAYRAAWRAKMDEVNACIAANAEQEELVDQPEVVKGVVRVSGPFTVEGVVPEELSLTDDGVTDLTPNEFDDDARADEQNAEAYLDMMVRSIRRDGVLFLGNKKRMFSRVEPLSGAGTLSGLHAEAAWEGEDDLKVAIAFGPQYGPVTALQVESLIRASRRYEHLVIAAFSFAPEASGIISESSHPKLQIHMAHIRPDINPGMKGLLKETPNSQLFTVFGLPAVSVQKDKAGEYTVTLDGVDIYDPVENTVRSTKAEKVAAWFVDSDFDGRCFCITQAFFPNQDAWEKIQKALKGDADLDAFEAFKGTVSLPFKAGKHATVAVKVIDPRGNEVMTVKKLGG